MERCIGRDVAVHHVVSPAALRAGAGAALEPQQLAPVFAPQQAQDQPPRRTSPLPCKSHQQPCADGADAACAALDVDGDFEPSHTLSRTRKKVRVAALGQVIGRDDALSH
jgi:hypothetical protein